MMGEAMSPIAGTAAITSRKDTRWIPGEPARASHAPTDTGERQLGGWSPLSRDQRSRASQPTSVISQPTNVMGQA